MTALKRGFTLIELLIVMAILGVLAVVVLVAINPAEQLRRARDSGRISGVQQIGRAMAAYYTANQTLPAAAANTWDAVLTTTQELQVIPAGITPTGYAGCTGATVNGTWCYGVNAGLDQFAVWATLESQQRIKSCGAASTTAFAVFSSIDARGGVSQNAPAAGTTVTFCQ